MNVKPSKIKLVYTKITHWEFWPFELVYFPVIVYYVWLSLKAKSFFFFSASNPSIETGGMLGESKINILDRIPDNYKPLTIFIKKNTAFEDIVSQLKNAGLSFPIIVKPDVGERGKGVEKISSEIELQNYISECDYPLLIQEYIDYPIELGIFYYRYPNQKTGTVSSVVIKDFLTLVGDGKSTIAELISKNPRAGFQYNRLRVSMDFSKILKDKEHLLLEPIGNHCRGTKFLNGNYIIDQQLCNVFTEISNNIPDFHFGRYDLKCTSIEDLKAGRNIKIMELNGAGAEPAHIYDPKTSIFSAWKTLFFHWKILYEISIYNHDKGTPYMSFKEARTNYKKIRKA